jgi:hypothetical protein
VKRIHAVLADYLFSTYSLHILLRPQSRRVCRLDLMLRLALSKGRPDRRSNLGTHVISMSHPDTPA